MRHTIDQSLTVQAYKYLLKDLCGYTEGAVCCVGGAAGHTRQGGGGGRGGAVDIDGIVAVVTAT